MSETPEQQARDLLAHKCDPLDAYYEQARCKQVISNLLEARQPTLTRADLIALRDAVSAYRQADDEGRVEVVDALDGPTQRVILAALGLDALIARLTPQDTK